MEPNFHSLAELFRQLGLPDDDASIERFVDTHRGLPRGTSLCDAPFFNDAQRRFLRDAVSQDADWSEPVDELASRLAK